MYSDVLKYGHQLTSYLKHYSLAKGKFVNNTLAKMLENKENKTSNITSNYCESQTRCCNIERWCHLRECLVTIYNENNISEVHGKFRYL